MSHWESQIRTNLEDPVYGSLLDTAIASAPGIQAAGLVNVRYAEGCLRLPNGQLAPESELELLIALTRGLFAREQESELPESYAIAFARLKPVESVYFTTHSERVFATGLSGERAIVVSVPSGLRLGAAMVLATDAGKALRANPLASVRSIFEDMGDVLAAGMVDTVNGTFVDVHREREERSEFLFDAPMARVIAQFFASSSSRSPLPVVFHGRDGERIDVENIQIGSATSIRNWWSLPFDPEHTIFLLSGPSVLPGLIWTVARRATDDTVRVWADGLLAWGIDSMIEPFPKTQRELLEIIEELRRLPENDLIERLRIGGFTNYSMGEGENVQRCQECVYYHPHRKWCDLPELPIPVEPHWWCRLWKS